MIKPNVISSFLFVFILNLATAQTPPNPQDDFDTAEIDTVLSVPAPGVLNNDSDSEGDVITVVSFQINGVVYNVGETANLAEGSFILFANGGFAFLPATGYTGSVPTISYTILDGLFTSSANLFLTVELPPVAEDDYDTAEINTVLSVPAPGVLINDFDPEGNAITVVSFQINGVVYNVGDTANFAQGSFTILADGSFTFTPTPGYTGNVPIISYTISNGELAGTAGLFLTVEEITDLIEFNGVSSCNQGYGTDGNYNIRYIVYP